MGSQYLTLIYVINSTHIYSDNYAVARVYLSISSVTPHVAVQHASSKVEPRILALEWSAAIAGQEACDDKFAFIFKQLIKLEVFTETS